MTELGNGPFSSEAFSETAAPAGILILALKERDPGQWEEGITGTTIKDTWTKSRGRVEWGREVGSAGVGWRDGEKRHTTVIE